MAYVVGDAISDTFILRDDAGAAITGKVAADFATLEAYSLPAAATTASVSLAEIGAGEYAFSFTPTTAATWTGHVVYAAGGIFREFSQTYAVAGSAATPGISGGTGTTRLNLARMIGRRLRELIVLTATSDGTNGTFYDTNNLRGPDNVYRGQDVWFPTTSEQRRVNASTQASGRIAWANAVLAPTVTGSGAELWNRDGTGVDRVQVNDAIDQCLVYAASNFWLPVVADVAAVFDEDEPWITIPAAITRGVSGVRFLDDEDDEAIVERAATNNGVGWSVRKGAGTLQIAGASNLTGMSGRTVRLFGYGLESRPATDGGSTTVNPEWIVAEACRLLTEQMAHSRPDWASRWYPVYEREAIAKRAMAVGRLAPGTEMMR